MDGSKEDGKDARKADDREHSAKPAFTAVSCRANLTSESPSIGLTRPSANAFLIIICRVFLKLTLKDTERRVLMSSSLPGSRDLPASRHDLSTYWGRVKHSADIADPR